MLPLIDSHCHIDMVLSRGVPQQQIDEACQSNGVERVVQIAADASAIDFALQHCKEPHPYEVKFTIGQHPGEVHEVDTSLCIKAAFEQKDNKDFVAVGEIGLDYHYGLETKEQQKEVFIEYLQAAVELRKPVCIHTREAHEDTMAALKTVSGDIPILIHCFTGNYQQMKDYLSLGCFISFSGIVTFKNAKELQEAALHCPLENMLVETDAPYLTPVPHRGKPNHPAMVRHTANFIADLKQIQADQVAEATYANTCQFYAI